METREALRIGIAGVLALAVAHVAFRDDLCLEQDGQIGVVLEPNAVIPEPTKPKLLKGFTTDI